MKLQGEARCGMMEAMDENVRRLRAEERRRRAVLHRARLGEVEPDLDPVCGPEAISLVALLTRACWSLSGRPWPRYARSEAPYRFVPGQRS